MYKRVISGQVPHQGFSFASDSNGVSFRRDNGRSIYYRPRMVKPELD